jgi:hypothetical protein
MMEISCFFPGQAAESLDWILELAPGGLSQLMNGFGTRTCREKLEL